MAQLILKSMYSDGMCRAISRTATTADTSRTSGHVETVGASGAGIGRVAMEFDIPQLPLDAQITDITLYVCVYSVVGTANLGICQSFRNSLTELVASDFIDIGSDNGTAGRANYTGIQEATSSRVAASEGYIAFPFNATGLSWINLNEILKLGIREARDMDDAIIDGNYALIYMRDEEGTERDPYMVINYTSDSGAMRDATTDEPEPKSVNIPTPSSRLADTSISYDLSDIKKKPYLCYLGDNTTMRVTWQLNSTRESWIEWGTTNSYGNSAETVEFYTDNVYSYIITGLTPGIKYFYRIREGNTINHTGTFYAAPAVDSNVKILAFGDSRLTSDNISTYNTICGKMIDEITSDEGFQSICIHTGDISYSTTEDSYQNYLFSQANAKTLYSKLPIQYAEGNHEMSPNDDVFFKYFLNNYESPAYYSFDYGNIHFCIINQYQNYDIGSTQSDWIVADLANTDRPFKIVCYHVPMYSDDGGGYGSNVGVRENLRTIFSDNEVNLVISAHNHIYCDSVVDNIHHVVTGGAGAILRDPANTATIVEGDGGTVNYVEKTFHYLTIQTNNDTLTVTAKNSLGNTIHTFDITVETPNVVEMKHCCSPALYF